MLIRAYDGAGRPADAVAVLEAESEHSPSSRTLRQLATALLTAGETTRARDVLLEVVELQPTDLAGLYQLSDGELRLNNLDRG